MAVKIMKEKYFKHNHFLDANKRHGPSMIWTSLWSSMDLVKEGLIWRVRNEHLIDKENRRWNENFINEIFKRDEAEQICSVPISKFGAQDKLMQGHTKNGIYSIKSAYYVEHIRRTMKVVTLIENDANVGWKRIRELNVPRVVKTSY